MSQTDQMMRIRIPQDLKDWVEQESLRQDRSRNAQFVHCLRQARLQAEAGQSGGPAVRASRKT
jgi:hypothetical protein